MSYYKILSNRSFSLGKYSLVPIRFEDRFDIMKWRNEQIYHLRQSKLLTEEDQNNYFAHVVSELFRQEQPGQILFSYLENGKCIGYGGLVHINWIDKNAEISFVIDSLLEKEEFCKHWTIYLGLLETIAFDELNLHKIYTYAFDLRPHLYKSLEAYGLRKEAVFKEHCLFNGEYKDVIIHSIFNKEISLRRITKEDKQLLFRWANDKSTRQNSFESSPISIEKHSEWFDRKIKDREAFYFICEIKNNPAGLVRFDKEQNKFIIGITIDINYRGRKLAPPFLTRAVNYVYNLTQSEIIAFIKQDNYSSIRSFEKAGFTRLNNIKINGVESYEYIFRY